MPKAITPQASETKPTFQLPQSIQNFVNRLAPGRRYFAHELPNAPELPEALCSATPPEIPKGNVALCLEYWKLLRPAFQSPRLDPAWRSFIVELREAAHAGQQGMPVLVIDYQAQAESRADLISNGERRRAAESAELQAALANGFDGIPIAPEKEIPEVVLTYLATDGLGLARALRSKLAQYQIMLNEPWNFALLNPETRRDERTMALNSNPTPEAMKVIVAESLMAGTREKPAEHFRQISSAAKAKLYAFWTTEIKGIETQMLGGAMAFANQCREASIAAEQQFFAFAGVKHDGTAQTAVARRFDSAIADLKHNRDLLARSSGGTLSDACGSSVLCTVFGVPAV